MDNCQPSQNQPVTGSVSHLLWNLDRLLPVRKCITIMMKLMACHLSSDRVQKKLITNYVTIFGGNMHQLCGEQTGLCGHISTVDKSDIKRLNQMYRTTVKPKELQILTRNLTSSMEFTSFTPTLTFA